MNVANMYIGQGACRYGITTGYHCNQISQLVANYSYIFNGVLLGFGGMVGATPHTAAPGDSGGPWMNGAIAFGIHTADNGSTDYFMPIERISVQGLYILTYWTP